MKKTIDFYDFNEAFIDYRRTDNFSYAGRKALFEYLEEYEQDIGEEIELDVIALCCEYSEFNSLANFNENYPDILDTDTCNLKNLDKYDIEICLDVIREHTTVIVIDGEQFIIRIF